MHNINKRLVADFKKYVINKQTVTTTYSPYSYVGQSRTTNQPPMYANQTAQPPVMPNGYQYKMLTQAQLAELNGGSYNISRIGRFPTSKLDECSVFYYESCSMYVSCRHFCSIDALIAYCAQLKYVLTPQQITQIRMANTSNWYLCRNINQDDHFFIRRTKEELAKVVSDAWVEKHNTPKQNVYEEKFYN